MNLLLLITRYIVKLQLQKKEKRKVKMAHRKLNHYAIIVLRQTLLFDKILVNNTYIAMFLIYQHLEQLHDVITLSLRLLSIYI